MILLLHCDSKRDHFFPNIPLPMDDVVKQLYFGILLEKEK